MNGRKVYEIWAPKGGRWSAWVRPVCFYGIDVNRDGGAVSFDVPVVSYAAAAKPDTAIILDLPGSESVKESIALAGLGYRPVPLFNGTDAQTSAPPLIDNGIIETALLLGAERLKNIILPVDAPPAFLLDSSRINRYKPDVSAFDNSWDIYGQDMPSAEYMQNSGIKNIIVRGGLLRDLRIILYKYQSAGIKISVSERHGQPQAVTVKKPTKKIIKLGQ